MPHEEYLKAARKLLRGITKKDLLTAENRKRIIDMVNAEELELWEINDEILSLKLIHGDIVEESQTYDKAIPSYKPLREHRYKESGTDYTWMYQQKETPEYLGDFNDYFVKAITEKNDSYFTAFCYSAALPLFIHSSTSLGLYFQPRPTLWAGMPFSFIQVSKVSRVTPRYAHISFVENQRSGICEICSIFISPMLCIIKSIISYYSTKSKG